MSRDEQVDQLRIPPALDRAAALAWRGLLVVIAAAVGLYALARLRIVALPIIVAVLGATVLWSPTQWLRRHRVPDALAALLVLLAAALVLLAVTSVIGVRVSDEFGDLTDQASEAVDDVEEWFIDGPLDLKRSTVEQARDDLDETLSANSGSLTSGAIQAGSIAVELVTGLVLSVVLLFFVLKDGQLMAGWIRRHLAESRADDVIEVGGEVWQVLGGYLRGVAITGLVNAVVIGIGLVLLGVPLPLPLAVLTFVGAFVPLVGATVTGALAAGVALVGNGPGTAVAVVVLTLIVQQLEGDVLAPFVLSRAVEIHPVTILLALAAGSVLAGIAGAFLAVPVAATVKTVIHHYRPPLDESDPDPPST